MANNNLIPLMEAIARGEANNGWDTVNVNSFGGQYNGIPVSQLSLDQVIAQQGVKHGAAGMFQGSKDTLKWFKRANELTGKEKFDEATQRKFFHWLLRNNPSVQAFLDADTDEDARKHLPGAGTYVASQWRGVQGPNGRGYSDGDKYGNKASVAWKDIESGLLDYRRAYQESQRRAAEPQGDYITLESGDKVLVPTDPEQKKRLYDYLKKQRMGNNVPSTKLNSDHSKPLTESQRIDIEKAMAEEQKNLDRHMEDYRKAQRDINYVSNWNPGAILGKIVDAKGMLIDDAAKAVAGDSKVADTAVKAGGRLANTASYMAGIPGAVNAVIDTVAGLSSGVGNWIYNNRAEQDKPQWLQDLNTGMERAHKNTTVGNDWADMGLDITGGALPLLYKGKQLSNALKTIDKVGDDIKNIVPYLKETTLQQTGKRLQSSINDLERMGASPEAIDAAQKFAKQTLEHRASNIVKQQKRDLQNYTLANAGAVAGTVAGSKLDDGGGGSLAGGILGTILAPRAYKMAANRGYVKPLSQPETQPVSVIRKAQEDFNPSIMGQAEEMIRNDNFDSYTPMAGQSMPISNLIKGTYRSLDELREGNASYNANQATLNKLANDFEILQGKGLLDGENLILFRDTDAAKSLGEDLKGALEARRSAEISRVSDEYQSYLNEMFFKLAENSDLRDRVKNSMVREEYNSQVNPKASEQDKQALWQGLMDGMDEAKVEDRLKEIIEAPQTTINPTTGKKESVRNYRDSLLSLQVDDFVDKIRNDNSYTPGVHSLARAYQDTVHNREIARPGLGTFNNAISSVRDYVDAMQDLNERISTNKVRFTNELGKSSGYTAINNKDLAIFNDLRRKFEDTIFDGSDAVKRKLGTEKTLRTKLDAHYKRQKDEERWWFDSTDAGKLGTETVIDKLYERIVSGKITQSEAKNLMEYLIANRADISGKLGAALWAKHLTPKLREVYKGGNIDPDKLPIFSNKLGSDINKGYALSNNWLTTKGILELLEIGIGSEPGVVVNQVRRALNNIAANGDMLSDLKRDPKGRVNNSTTAAENAISSNPGTGGTLQAILKFFNKDKNKRLGQVISEAIEGDPDKFLDRMAEIQGAGTDRRRSFGSVASHGLGLVTGSNIAQSLLDDYARKEYNEPNKTSKTLLQKIEEILARSK